jgi:hypothetical protein
VIARLYFPLEANVIARRFMPKQSPSFQLDCFADAARNDIPRISDLITSYEWENRLI